ncbi:hypothetical protein ABZ172_25040 [Streptomyces sp. NPDC006296]|uniref:hypothetical protein n=1 Tax=Streptomyces sp. NPDC006296 TaxID=3156746 RepID=UPI0033B1315C
MNLRTASLAVVALLGATGCVSVPPEAQKPRPALSGRPDGAAAVQASPSVAVAPPAVHDALGREDDTREGADAKRKKERDAPAGPAASPPPRAEARNRPPRAVPAAPPRLAGVPRPAPPRGTYDMRTVCATGQGVASAEVVDLCRATYGR